MKLGYKNTSNKLYGSGHNNFGHGHHCTSNCGLQAYKTQSHSTNVVTR